MVWLLALLIAPAFAQVDLSAIQELDEELPTFNDYKQSDEEIEFTRQNRKFRPPTRVISVEEIKQSGTQVGAIRKGTLLRNIETNKNAEVTKLIYVKTFNLEDEHQFRYIQNKDGSMTWRVKSNMVEPLKEELSMYVPPLQYTPAPTNIVRTVYDKKLNVRPEISFYTGIVRGDYMGDLFNDNKARSGLTNQFNVHFFTEWKLPVKVGGVFHYERASYNLSNGGQVFYTSPSIGPQFKTRDFEFLGQPLRFQTNFRVSPLARATAKTLASNTTVKFNSADLVASLERPIKNGFGEFVVGAFYQSQWLNIRDQSSAVRLQASNETNKSFGLTFAQVFE